MPRQSRTPSIVPQPRDLEVLRGLFESRIMTLRHLAAIHFDGRAEAAKKRIGALKAAGYVRERPRLHFEPSTLFLTKRGYGLLHERGLLEGYPSHGWAAAERRLRLSPLTIRHELEVIDVKSAFVSGARSRPGVEIPTFSTWPALHEFDVPRRAFDANAADTLKPDGFIRLLHRGEDGSRTEHACFLELDRSTETLDVLCRKIAAYVAYYRSGGFAVRQGAESTRYQEYPFRVLVVCRSDARVRNLAERLLQSSPPVLTQAWLSTHGEVTAAPFDRIWRCPVDLSRPTSGDARMKCFQTEGRPLFA